MIRALRTAASGMYAQELQLDNTANNLANIQTTGYKSQRVNFQDLYYDHIPAPSSLSRESASSGMIEVGYGSQVAGTSRNYQQGTVVATENPTDVAIMGDGFLRLEMPDGNYGYTRDGALQLSPEGTLVTSSGYQVDPQIVVPPETSSLAITQDGVVWGYMPGDTEPQQLGQITLTRFINPSGMKGMGENIFTATDASGEAVDVIPGEEGAGIIKQGYLEQSNVSSVEEMVTLMSCQRAYEINSKSIKAADQVLGTISDLRR
ncbi:MAG: flagellar basal-body rod protein FlgG [Candidatus Zixiibacteriota bacterium]